MKSCPVFIFYDSFFNFLKYSIKTVQNTPLISNWVQSYPCFDMGKTDIVIFYLTISDF